jgi:hypothetical protein
MRNIFPSKMARFQSLKKRIILDALVISTVTEEIASSFPKIYSILAGIRKTPNEMQLNN